MGLVPAFVFSVNRRAVLAVLAIAVSVTYTLVAGAAVGGLKDAQAALAGGLDDTYAVVIDPELEALDTAALPSGAVTTLSVVETEVGTFYAVRSGDALDVNATTAVAGPSTGLRLGDNVSVAGANRTVVAGAPAPGARPDWTGVDPAALDAIAQDGTAGVHVAVFNSLAPSERAALERAGLAVVEAPAAFPFYEAGAEQVVGTVRFTVVASTVVVALLTLSFVALELRARRRSFATLQLYAGPRTVRALVAARGLALLVAGHALAVAVTVGLVWLLGRASGVALALPAEHLQVSVAATLGGGLVGLVPPLVRSSRPLTARELETRAPSRRGPRLARPTLASWRSAVPLAASAMVLAGSLGVVFGTVDMPAQLFGTGDASVIASTANNPLRGTVDAFPGLHLGAVDGFEASSPEVFAPSVFGQRPVMVRGVVWDNLVDLDDVRLVRGRALEGSGDVVLGQRLAAALGAAPGHRLVVPSAYTASALSLVVAGVASGPGLLDDEAFVTLEAARALTGLPPDAANIVRYRVSPGTRENLTSVSPVPTGIEVTGLLVAPLRPLPHQDATALVTLVNFAPIERSRHLTLRVNGEAVADSWVTLAGRSTGTAELTFRVPLAGVLTVQVNPTTEVETAEPSYRFDAARAAAVGRPFTLRVVDQAGAPAAGVDVHLDDAEAVTAVDGTATLTPAVRGNRTLVADGPDGRGATSLLVVDPADLYRPRVVFHSLVGPSQVAASPWRGAAVVENVGGAPLEGALFVPVDGEPVNASAARLVPGARARVTLEVALAAGQHTIGPPDVALDVFVGASGAPGDGGDGGDGGLPGPSPSELTVAELLELRRERARTAVGSDVDPTAAFLGDTFENLNVALTVVTLATAVHAALVVVVVVHRDLEERATNVGTLAAIGAGRATVRATAVREFLVVGAAGAALGTLGGLALAWGAAEAGLLAGFGHALVPRTGLGFGVRVAAASLAITLASAAVLAEAARSRTIGRLLHEGPVRPARPPLGVLLEEGP